MKKTQPKPVINIAIAIEVAIGEGAGEVMVVLLAYDHIAIMVI